MRYLTALLIFALSFSFLNTFAQKENENLKEIFMDAEFFFINEDYSEALSNYQQIYKRGYQENGNINYRIGQCYLNITGEKGKAISYLEKAVKLTDSRYLEGAFKETHAPNDAYFYLGKAYRIDNQFDKAIENYQAFKKMYEGKDAERINLVNQEIEACKYAVSQILKPENVYTQEIGRPVSTGNRDVFPVVSGDKNSIVYITKLKFYDALYSSRKVNGKWTTPINITPDVQSDGDQYPTFISYDGKELYLRKEDNFEADLMVSKKESGVWSKSKSMGKNINSKYFEGNMSISKDGKTLFFSSNRKEGSGAMDLYKSIRQANGDWGAPVNLGNVINTPFNEDAPYISDDGTRLYFISQGHQTMGGYDVFSSTLSADGSFSKPVNLGYPINTTDDDIYFYPLDNGAIAYTSINRKGNLGFEDIYEMYVNPSPDLMATLKLKPKEEVVNVSEEVIQALIPDAPGTVQPVGQEPLAVEADKEVKQPEQTQGKSNTETPKERTIYLPIIFFDFNSTELAEKSKKSLDYMVTLIKNNGEFKIELTGHTDAVGSSEYNNILGEKRAIAVSNYLINNGISKAAVIIKSMGETKFIAKNTNADGTDNPDGRKFNRRVEMRILENNPDSKIVIEELKIPDNLRIKKP
jgi:outer membrane protein OmpA-like peptidoglycan-associated protein/tetratricopeptide (TPR) repeat protein